MKIITAIKPQRNRQDIFNLFIDGKFSFSVGFDVITEAGLYPGQELSDHELDKLKESGQFRRALDLGLRYLSYRPRSQAELRTRLRRYGCEAGVIERVLAELRRMGLADDEEFARFWKENRESFNPRGQRLLASELRSKGVDAEIISEVIAGIDEELSAYQAGRKRAKNLSGLEYYDFRKNLGGFLQRRGFGYAVVRDVVERLWREQPDEK